jgi:hypothetical protein
MAKKGRGVVPRRGRTSVPSKKFCKKKSATIPTKTLSPLRWKNETAINAATKVERTEIISLPPAFSPGMDLLKNLHEVDGEKLGEYIEGRLGGVCTTLRHLQPLIVEIKRRFKLLPRGKRMDGTYNTIRGCRTFKEWVATKLKRTDRAVYYLLSGGNPQNEKAKLARTEAKKAKEEQRGEAHEKVEPTVEGVPEEQEIPSTRAARLKQVIEGLKTRKTMIEVLRDEVQEIAKDTEGILPGASECTRDLEVVLGHLDNAISDAWRISFPGGDGSNAAN